MLRCGMPLYDALLYTARDEAHTVMAQKASEIADNIARGQKVYEAFHPLQDSADMSFLRVAHHTGSAESMTEVFIQFTQVLTIQLQNKRLLRQLLLYPLFLVGMSACAVLFITFFVVPMIADIIKDLSVPLPFISRVLLWIGIWLQQYRFSFFIGASLVVSMSVVPFFRRILWQWLQSMILMLPGVSSVVKKIWIARCCRDISMYLVSGMDIVSSLKCLMDGYKNVILKDVFFHIYTDVQKGLLLSQAMEKAQWFPHSLIGMVCAGEKTNSLETVFTDCAGYYEEEVKEKMTLLCTCLEPVLILSMGVVIGTMVVAVLLPIYEMTSHIGV